MKTLTLNPMLALALAALFIVGCRQSPEATAPATATPTTAASRPTASPGDPEATASAIAEALPTGTAALAEGTPALTPTSPTPTASPAPPRVLTVCAAIEPGSLYLYDPAAGPSAHHVWAAIYESPIRRSGYSLEPVGLEQVPDATNDAARLETVIARQGDLVVDANGFVQTLARGVTLRTATDELLVYRDGEVPLTRLVVDFTFRPMLWSDGTPVTADDSRFSFELAFGRNPDEAAARERIGGYQAIDEHTIRYSTLPGWIDPEYWRQLRPPLPRHALGALAPADVPLAEAAARAPLASGPFMVAEWLPGERLVLARNPRYYRAAEGLPRLDRLEFRFTPEGDEALAGLLAGSCDVITQEGLTLDLLPLLQANAEAGLLQLQTQPGPVLEHLDFAVAPSDTYAARRPAWFGDVAVRRALGQCVDRQAIVDAVQPGAGGLARAYVADGHPLLPADLEATAYDPNRANALLDEAGFVDNDGDGIRQAPGSDTPFRVTLSTTLGGDLRPQVADLIAGQLAACGIAVEPRLLPVGELFADGPVGSIFGRQFDLSLFGWLTDVRPPCNLYVSAAIPGAPERYPAGWSGVNVTGWADASFDDACDRALRALPGSADYTAAHAEALRRFAAEAPSLPLFFRARLSASRPDVVGVSLQPLEESELWNAAALDLRQEIEP